MSKGQRIAGWVGQLAVAGLLVMAAVPKLTGQADAVGTFETLGAEPFGRYLVGLWEVVTVALMLVGFVKPRAAAIGGILGVLAMVGALGAHATKLGFSGQNGMMAGLAVVILVASGVVVYVHRGALLRGRAAAAG